MHYIILSKYNVIDMVCTVCFRKHKAIQGILWKHVYGCLKFNFTANYRINENEWGSGAQVIIKHHSKRSFWAF